MKTSKIKKIALRGGVLFVAVILVAAAFLFSFSSKIKKSFLDILQEDVSDFVNYGAESLSKTLQNNMSGMELLSDAINEGDISEADIISWLRVIEDTTDTYQTIYVDTDLKAVDYQGIHYDMSGVDYTQIFETKTNQFFYIENDGFADLGNEAILAVSPVISSGGDVNGHIVEYIRKDIIDECLSTSNINLYSFYVILDKNHEYQTVTGKYSNSNFATGDVFENIKANLDSSGATWDVIDKMFISKGITLVSHAKIGDEGRYISYANVKGADWVILICVSESYIKSEIDQLYEPVSTVIAEFMVIFGVFFVLYIVIMLFIFATSDESKRILEGKAETDLLTGLCNKLATERKIAEYIENNPNGQAVMIIIDVDNFKKVNDTMGHAFGDEVLRNLGVRLKSLFRTSDIIGRIGGDEFVVFLKDVNDTAIIVREARKLETFFKGFEVGEYVKYSVTASLGAAIYSMDGRSFDDLYKNADRALYEAKHKGKKQLAFYKEEEKSFLDKPSDSAKDVENESEINKQQES